MVDLHTKSQVSILIIAQILLLYLIEIGSVLCIYLSKNTSLNFPKACLTFIQHLISNHHYKDPGGLDITEPSQVKDLGILFSPDLSFKVHTDKMVKQVNKLIGWVFRTFRSRSIRVMMTVWRSLIQPKLDYCSQLWSPPDAKTINLLEDI